MADIESLSDLCIVRGYKKKTNLPFTHSTNDKKLGKTFCVPDADRDLLIQALDNERTINLQEHLTDRFRFFVELLGSTPPSDSELRTFCGLCSSTLSLFYPTCSKDHTMIVLTTAEGNEDSPQEEEAQSCCCRIIFPHIVCEASQALRIQAAYKCVLHSRSHGEARKRVTGFSFPNEEAILSPKWESLLPRTAYLHQTGHSLSHSQVFEKCPEANPGCGERCQVCAGRKCVPKGRALYPRTVLKGEDACFGSDESDLLVCLKNRKECFRRTMLRCSDESITEGYSPPQNAPYVPVRVTEKKVSLPECFREESKLHFSCCGNAAKYQLKVQVLSDTKSPLCHMIRKAIEEFKLPSSDSNPLHVVNIKRYGIIDMTQKHTYKVCVGGFTSHSCSNYQGTHTEDETNAGGRIYFLIDKDGIHQKCSCLTVPTSSRKACNKYASKGQPLSSRLNKMLGYIRTTGNDCFMEKMMNVYIPNLERIMHGQDKPKKRKRTK